MRCGGGRSSRSMTFTRGAFPRASHWAAPTWRTPRTEMRALCRSRKRRRNTRMATLTALPITTTTRRRSSITGIITGHYHCCSNSCCCSSIYRHAGDFWAGGGWSFCTARRRTVEHSGTVPRGTRDPRTPIAITATPTTTSLAITSH